MNITTTAWKAMHYLVQEHFSPDNDVVRATTHDCPFSAAYICQMAVFSDGLEGRSGVR